MKHTILIALLAAIALPACHRIGSADSKDTDTGADTDSDSETDSSIELDCNPVSEGPLWHDAGPDAGPDAGIELNYGCDDLVSCANGGDPDGYECPFCESGYSCWGSFTCGGLLCATYEIICLLECGFEECGINGMLPPFVDPDCHSKPTTETGS